MEVLEKFDLATIATAKDVAIVREVAEVASRRGAHWIATCESSVYSKTNELLVKLPSADTDDIFIFTLFKLQNKVITFLIMFRNFYYDLVELNSSPLFFLKSYSI